MTPLHPLPDLTIRGNGEERVAQIELIQARGERLRRDAVADRVQRTADRVAYRPSFFTRNGQAVSHRIEP